MSEFCPVGWVANPSTLFIQWFFKFISYFYLVLQRRYRSGLPIFSALQGRRAAGFRTPRCKHCSPRRHLPSSRWLRLGYLSSNLKGESRAPYSPIHKESPCGCKEKNKKSNNIFDYPYILEESCKTLCKNKKRHLIQMLKIRWIIFSDAGT